MSPRSSSLRQDSGQAAQARSLPEHASLEALKKQAKALLKSRRQQAPNTSTGLQECQHALARDYGFKSWTDLKGHLLFEAASGGDLEAAQEWLASGGNLEFRRGEHNMTPLMAAASNGHFAIVTALVAAGADVGAANENGHTALGFASWPGHLDIVDYLLRRGADNNRGMPLQQAASHGNLAVVRSLVASGADVNATDQEGGTALSWAADPGRLDVIEYLVEHGADLTAGTSALATACENGHLEIARYLVRMGADIETGLGKYDMTPLVGAAINGHREIVDFLLAQGADLHAKGDYALEWSAQLGKQDMVDHLLSLGADINAAGPLGVPVLQQVTDDGKLDTARFLLERGADPDRPSPDGTTARKVAVEKGLTALVELFDAASAGDPATSHREGRHTHSRRSSPAPSDSPTTIRSFTKEDLPAMVAIVKQHESIRFHGSLIADVLVDLQYQRGFVAEDGTGIIGFLASSSEDGVPHITYVGVADGNLRRGIGTRLVEAAEKEAVEAGADVLRVVVMGWTSPHNRQFAGTRRFYKSLGFEIIRKHPILTEENGDRWRLYTLEKKL